MTQALLAETTRVAASMSPRERLYPETLFGDFSRRDGTMAFYSRVNALIGPNHRVLDYGCGIGSHIRELSPYLRSLQALRGKVKEVIGADVDTSSRDNPYVDRFVPITADGLDLDGSSVDLCVCDWGLEHFDEPAKFFAECHRVLRPGGVLCFRTPNRFHYSSLGASILPFRYHQAVRRWLGQFHAAEDVFPTFYRCNTRRQIARSLRHHGFEAGVWPHRGDSHLVRAGRVAGLLGEAIEWMSPPALWHELHAFGRKLA